MWADIYLPRYYWFLYTECRKILRHFCAVTLLCLVVNNFGIFGIHTLIFAYFTALDGWQIGILKANLLPNTSEAESQFICTEASDDGYTSVQLYHCCLVVYYVFTLCAQFVCTSNELWVHCVVKQYRSGIDAERTETNEIRTHLLYFPSKYCPLTKHVRMVHICLTAA